MSPHKPNFVHTSFLALALAISAPDALAQFPEKPNPHVRFSLLADTKSIKPGKPFTIGLLLNIQPKWHIYWTGPGPAGKPTEVKFTSNNPNLTISPLNWPTPKKYAPTSPFYSIGYDTQTLIFATATLKPSKSPPQSLTINTSVSWLACKGICVAGSGATNLKIPISEKSAPANTDLFKKYRAQTPLSPKSKSYPIQNITQNPIHPETGRRSVKITWKSPAPKTLDLYPNTLHSTIELKDIKFQNKKNTTIVSWTTFIHDKKALPKSGQIPALLVVNPTVPPYRSFKLNLTVLDPSQK